MPITIIEDSVSERLAEFITIVNDISNNATIKTKTIKLSDLSYSDFVMFGILTFEIVICGVLLTDFIRLSLMLMKTKFYSDTFKDDTFKDDIKYNVNNLINNTFSDVINSDDTNSNNIIHKKTEIQFEEKNSKTLIEKSEIYITN